MKIKGKTSLVIAGSWNVSVITPNWIAEQIDWLSSDENVPLEVAIGTGATRFTIEDIDIQTAPNRLDLIAATETPETYDRIGELGRAIVEELPHTPLQAVGHNIVYSLEENESFRNINGMDIDRAQELYQDIAGALAVNTMQLKHAIEYDDRVLNLTFRVSRKEVSIDFNYHYAITKGVRVVDLITAFADSVNDSRNLASKLVTKE